MIHSDQRVFRTIVLRGSGSGLYIEARFRRLCRYFIKVTFIPENLLFTSLCFFSSETSCFYCF